MRILWASPLPPVRSGVADYAVELLPELSKLSDVRVVSDPSGEGPRPGSSLCGCPVVSADAAPLSGEIQLVHLGNNPYHVWLLDRLEIAGTVAVVHDAVLHHLLVEATLARGDGKRFEERLLAAHPEAEPLVRGRRFSLIGPRDPFLFPARRAYLGSAAGVIVHSRWAELAVRRDLPELPVANVSLPVADPGVVDRDQVRRQLNVVRDTLLVMHLGFLTPQKGLQDLLTAVAVTKRQGVPVRLLMVGEGHAGDALARAILQLGLEDTVGFTGWVPAESFPAVPAAADLGVVLRTPSAGETSAAALRFLACGTPVAVSAVRQYLELPAEVALRVTPGPSAPADLARILSSAWQAREAWHRRRTAARQFYTTGHTPAIAAGQLVSAIGRLTA